MKINLDKNEIAFLDHMLKGFIEHSERYTILKKSDINFLAKSILNKINK